MPNINEGDHWTSNNVKFFENRPVVNNCINYLKKIILKLIETLMSVKVWVIFSVMGITTWMIINNYITGDNLTSIWIGVITPICLMRESFKLTRIFTDAKQKVQEMIYKSAQNKVDGEQ